MTAQPMMQGVQNPELMFRSPALPEPLRARLLELGYAPGAVSLLMDGLPIVYTEQHHLVIEYPDGRRVQVERYNDYDGGGAFQRYRYRIIRRLAPAAR